MDDDSAFQLSAFFGCLVGFIVGYHHGSVTAGVDGSFVGFAAAAACIALLAELSFALGGVSAFASRLLERLSPFLTLGVLFVLARGYWM